MAIYGSNFSYGNSITYKDDGSTSAFFYANITRGQAPTDITFYIDGNVSSAYYSFLWDFGDGGSSIEETPTHTYTVPGVYTVKLILTFINDDVNTIIRSNYIKIYTYGIYPFKTNKSYTVGIVDLFSNKKDDNGSE